jgi:hypothetical protein
MLQYAFMAWCSVKAQGHFTFTFTLAHYRDQGEHRHMRVVNETNSQYPWTSNGISWLTSFPALSLDFLMDDQGSV